AVAGGGRGAAATREDGDAEQDECRAHQRARLACASKLSIGSMPSEVSLNESDSGHTRLAALITSPASRAAASLWSMSGRAPFSVYCASSPVFFSCVAAA